MEEIPFAGELIQVRDDERDWEGAAERLLRGFGLALLVPDAHYKAVAEWVDGAHLRGRLVYFHVRSRKSAELPGLHRDSLARKLAIKPDSPHYDWLERELAHRFDVACCATQEQFRRETRAITRAGQIKDPSGRHEKDDRHRINDRSRYVLGWSNTAKIAALEAKRRQLEAQLGEVGSEIGIIQKQRDELASRLDALTRLEEFTVFDEQDWASVATEIAQLVDERNQLESASDVLKQLNEKPNAPCTRCRRKQGKSCKPRARSVPKWNSGARTRKISDSKPWSGFMVLSSTMHCRQSSKPCVPRR